MTETEALNIHLHIQKSVEFRQIWESSVEPIIVEIPVTKHQSRIM
jgi:hypothetical protein